MTEPQPAITVVVEWSVVAASGTMGGGKSIRLRDKCRDEADAREMMRRWPEYDHMERRTVVYTAWEEVT